jgi:hypothetical protein
MRTLYAIALICLSVPAFASELDFDLPHDSMTKTGYLYDPGADLNFGDEDTATIFTSATPKNKDHSGAALETRYLYDDEADLNVGEENTGMISVSAAPKSEDRSLELDLGADESQAYQHDIVDLDAIPVGDWF